MKNIGGQADTKDLPMRHALNLSWSEVCNTVVDKTKVILGLRVQCKVNGCRGVIMRC